MIQIIKRHDGYKSQKYDSGAEGKVQVSINSDGHLVIRVITNSEQDTLIVLDPYATNTVIDFIIRLQQKFNIEKETKIEYRDLPF